MNSRINRNTTSKLLYITISIITIYSVYCIYPYLNVDPLAWTQTALTYEYGFIASAFIGTIYRIFDKILPFNIINYTSLKLISVVLTTSFTIFILCSITYCYNKIDSKVKYLYLYVSIVFCLFFFPTTFSSLYLGKYDYILLFLSLLNCYFIMKESYLFITAISSLLCICIHEGYVFMFANLTLVLLLIKSIQYLGIRKPSTQEKRKALSFFLYFTICFLIDSILFIYFQFLTKPVSVKDFENAITVAKMLSPNGHSYLLSFLQQNLQKIDYIKEMNVDFEIKIKELLFFLAYMFPYTFIFIKFIVAIYKEIESKTDYLRYSLLLAGPLTMLPEFILKEDYGRWILCIIIYYFIIFSVLLVSNDYITMSVLTNKLDNIKKLPLRLQLLIILFVLLYPFVFIPLGSSYISQITYILATYI